MYHWVVRRPLWFRALLSFWGLWLCAALSEAPGLHACPVHGEHSAHASHAGHMAHGSPASVPGDKSHHGSANCTCLGSCCCAAPVATPASSIELAGAILVDVPPARRPHVERPVVHRAYSLPFANGPPAA